MLSYEHVGEIDDFTRLCYGIRNTGYPVFIVDDWSGQNWLDFDMVFIPYIIALGVKVLGNYFLNSGVASRWVTLGAISTPASLLTFTYRPASMALEVVIQSLLRVRLAYGLNILIILVLKAVNVIVIRFPSLLLIGLACLMCLLHGIEGFCR